jgi:excisionase family DNA binding protein
MVDTKFKMLTIDEAAALSGLPRCAIRKVLIDGDLPHIMIGKTYRINEAVFLKFLQGEITANKTEQVSAEAVATAH